MGAPGIVAMACKLAASATALTEDVWYALHVRGIGKRHDSASRRESARAGYAGLGVIENALVQESVEVVLKHSTLAGGNRNIDIISQPRIVVEFGTDRLFAGFAGVTAFTDEINIPLSRFPPAIIGRFSPIREVAPLIRPNVSYWDRLSPFTPSTTLPYSPSATNRFFFLKGLPDQLIQSHVQKIYSTQSVLRLTNSLIPASESSRP